LIEIINCRLVCLQCRECTDEVEVGLREETYPQVMIGGDRVQLRGRYTGGDGWGGCDGCDGGRYK
jgi:hypothetical protein